MIEQVITYLNTVLAGYQLIAANYGLCELRPQDGSITAPVFWDSGKWHKVKFNRRGMSYIRKRGNVTVTEATQRASGVQNIEMIHPFRLVVMMDRSTTPTNSAFTPDELAYQIVKDFTFTGGDLKRQIKANQLHSRAQLYSTDTRVIVQEELAGVSNIDVNHGYFAAIIDFDITIHTFEYCIDDLCNAAPRFCLQLESYVALP